MRVVEFTEPGLPGTGGRRSGALAFNNIDVLLFSETRLNVAQAGP